MPNTVSVGDVNIIYAIVAHIENLYKIWYNIIYKNKQECIYQQTERNEVFCTHQGNIDVNYNARGESRRGRGQHRCHNINDVANCQLLSEENIINNDDEYTY